MALAKPLEANEDEAIITSDQVYISITENDIKVDDAVKFLSDESCGAIYLFLGVTRRDETDRHGQVISQIESLFYEAYETMAIKLMQTLVEDCQQQFGVKKCFIVHRKGLVKVSEASLLIGCSSAHREASHQATYHLLNQIKKNVPIWKKIVHKSETVESDESKWSSKSEAFWLQSLHEKSSKTSESQVKT